METFFRYFSWQRCKAWWQRYCWFLLPWLLCLPFPATRHVLRETFIGSPLVSDSRRPWTNFFDRSEKYEAAHLLKDQESDWRAQVAYIWRLQGGKHRGNFRFYSFNVYGDNGDKKRAQKLARKLVSRHPEVRWLGSFRLLMALTGNGQLNPRILQDSYWWWFSKTLLTPIGSIDVGFKLPKLSPSVQQEAKELLSVARRQTQLEPGNAFPWLAGAHVLMLEQRNQEARSWLRRAARCTYYDDHSVDVANAILHSFSQVHALSAAEQVSLIQTFFPDVYELSQVPLFNFAFRMGREQKRLQNAGNPRGVLHIMQDLLKCAGLIQRGRSIMNRRTVDLAMAQLAFTAFKTDLWSKGKLVPFDVQCRRYLGRYGWRTDAVKALKERQRLTRGVPQTRVYSYRQAIVPSVQEFQTYRALSNIIWWEVLLLAFVWGVVAAILYRAVGGPSSRRDRWFVALPVLLLMTGITLLVFWVENRIDRTQWTGQTYRDYEVFMSLVVLAVLAPVFVTMLMCAVGTWSRFRPVFLLPERVATEAKFSRFQTRLLLLWIPGAALSSVALLLISWAIWALATLYSWPTFDIAPYFQPFVDPKTPEMVSFQSPLPLMYAMFLTLFVSVLWLVKWLWFSAKHANPATHFGVRWYKESVGSVIVGLAWLFLVVALLSWPASNRVRAEWEQKVNSGVTVQGKPI